MSDEGTPLARAIEFRSLDVIRVLVEAGADCVGPITPGGQNTAIDLAKRVCSTTPPGQAALIREDAALLEILEEGRRQQQQVDSSHEVDNGDGDDGDGGGSSEKPQPKRQRLVDGPGDSHRDFNDLGDIQELHDEYQQVLGRRNRRDPNWRRGNKPSRDLYNRKLFFYRAIGQIYEQNGGNIESAISTLQQRLDGHRSERYKGWTKLEAELQSEQPLEERERLVTVYETAVRSVREACAHASDE